MTAVAPIRREVLVDAPPDVAFALFTAHIGSWWPMGAYSVYEGSVAFEGSRLVERSGAQMSVWAEVTEWSPPTRLALDWHPGHPDGPATTVELTFEPAGAATLVRLVHSGWEALAQPAAAREEYTNGWPGVLGRFAAAGTADAAKTGDTEASWFLLTHTPGPAVADGASVFAHPDFGEHFAFLSRLAERGLLVAAGPIPARSGAGAAVVRVPAGAAVDVPALASKDDQSVVRGLLEVRVEEWDVRLTGS